jgi:cytoskeleton protein RodZ
MDLGARGTVHMTSVGEMLRRERIRRNLSLDGISDQLKISTRLLEAIEEERFEKLPGGVFTRSFVRQYARYLGLDEDEVAGELQRTLEPQPAIAQSPENRKPEVEISLPKVTGWEAVGDKGSRWSSWVPSLILVLLVMLACSGAYYWLQRPHRLFASRPAQPITAQKSTSSQPESRPPALPPEAPAQVAAKADPDRENPPATPAAAPAAPSVTSAAAPAADPNPGATVRVQLIAQEPVWVSAITDGKVSFMGTLASNESRWVDANDSVLLKLGNAGGINILLNGKPIGPVGPRGQIRTLQLTSGGFHIVPPEPPSPAAGASPTAPRDPPPDPL